MRPIRHVPGDVIAGSRWGDGGVMGAPVTAIVPGGDAER